jgi:hypothetical protein
MSASRNSVPMIDTTIEPKHPSRLEKKANISGPRSRRNSVADRDPDGEPEQAWAAERRLMEDGAGMEIGDPDWSREELHER